MGFAALGVLGVGSTIASAIDNRNAERAAKSDRAELIQKLDLGTAIQRSLQDQLAKSTVEQQLMGGRVDQMKGALTAYGNMLGTTLARQNQAVLSNKQLRDRVLQLANRMRQLQVEWKDKQNRILLPAKSAPDWQAEQQALVQLHAEVEFTYRTTMEGEARFLRDVILVRFPPQPKTTEPVDAEAELHLDTGMLAGPYPLYEIAAYLEKLANKLQQ